jgi:hypothetical protein
MQAAHSARTPAQAHLSRNLAIEPAAFGLVATEQRSNHAAHPNEG